MAPMKPKPRREDSPWAGTVSLDQLARRWKMSRKEIRHLLGSRALGFVQIDGRFRVPLEEVEKYEEKKEPPIDTDTHG